MSKVCPNCQGVIDDNHASFCPDCGFRFVEMEKLAPTFNLGDANAISGGVNINQSKNITSHDVHYHTVQERNKSEKELLHEQQNQYHDMVAKLLKGGVITVEARAQLDKLKFNLGLDDTTTANIEATVKNEQKTQARATNDGLSVIGKMALKSAITAVEENNSQVQGCIAKLAPVCKTTMNEQVHFYYSMLMAACDPQRCVETYEKRTIDSYWLSYWASVAYRKMGNEMEAEGILTEMTGLWQERPEINVVINACLGIWLACKGNLAECQETIIEYLTQTEESPSDELNDLFHALLHAVGVEEDSPRFVFYNEHFLLALNEEEELKKAQEAYDNKDYETALAIWNQLAERNNATAIRKVGNCYLNGNGVSQDEAEAIKWYRKAIDLGDALAMYNLGFCYEKGAGVTQDYAEAVSWYSKAADLGNDMAMNNLGLCYKNGSGITQNYAEAVTLFRKAVDLGNQYAMANLGDCYRDGLGVAQNCAEAVSWYRKAADMGSDYAMNNLGMCYANGDGVAQDKAEAVKWYRKAADLGNNRAMNNLGLCYDNGSGVTQDKAEAFKWYRKAADLGHAGAMFNLGICYKNGEGIAQDLGEAVKWYRKAADLGHAGAMFSLGIRYKNGEGVAQDMGEVVKWYRKAADLGHAGAMNNLGVCYRDGTGITQNYAEAATLFRKAADLGDHHAMANLGDCYRDGSGVAQNNAEAVQWYRKASDLGNNYAMAELGDCYRDGKGVTEDSTEAAKWYQKAADLGNEYAKEQLEIMSEGDKVETVVCQCNQIKEPIPEAKFEKAWVTQDNEQAIGVHFALNITNSKGKPVTFKCVTKSLSPDSTCFKHTNVIFVHQQYSETPNWDDTRWDDYRYSLSESGIRYSLRFTDCPFELQTELSVYDSSDNCIGSYWIKYKVIYEERVFKNNRLLLASQDNEEYNEQLKGILANLEQLSNQLEEYKNSINNK